MKSCRKSSQNPSDSGPNRDLRFPGGPVFLPPRRPSKLARELLDDALSRIEPVRTNRDVA
ncbi:MAG: hypothetical protein AAGN66_27500 [Acidobacteriota bacterium]